jgi:hypothetical protein
VVAARLLLLFSTATAPRGGSDRLLLERCP